MDLLHVMAAAQSGMQVPASGSMQPDPEHPWPSDWLSEMSMASHRTPRVDLRSETELIAKKDSMSNYAFFLWRACEPGAFISQQEIFE